MKSSQSELETTLSESVMFQTKCQNYNAKCKKGNSANLVCISKKCLKSAFMCSQVLCNCSQAHKKCFIINLKQFTQKIESKVLKVDSYIDFHDKQVDDFIDMIIDEASKIKQQFKVFAQQKYKYCMLSQSQFQAFTNIKQNKVEKMSGQTCNELFMEMDDCIDKPYENMVQKQLTTIKQQWKRVQEVCKSEFLALTQQLANEAFKQIQQKKVFESSNIVKQYKQRKIMKNMFDKQINEVKLLYKATQNQFRLDKFYKNCTGIPNTITLIQTQFGKKIGGFTPLCWKKVQKDQQLADSQNSSFIFSISNNQKFKQKDLKSGIWNTKDTGPCFGGGSSYDIKISNQGDKKDCNGYFNNGYTHPNYTQINSQINKRFSGNPNNSWKFKAKQWQVWKVQFKQKLSNIIILITNFQQNSFISLYRKQRNIKKIQLLQIKLNDQSALFFYDRFVSCQIRMAQIFNFQQYFLMSGCYKVKVLLHKLLLANSGFWIYLFIVFINL